MAERVITRYGQLRRGGTYAVVESVARRPTEGAFPPLMDDVRANYLLSAEGEKITAYLKTVAGPYTGEHGAHLLVVPDAKDKSNLPGIKDLLPVDLGTTLQMVEAIAYATLQQPGIDEVDFGWHHSRAEYTGIPKQRAATFPKNLHIHITGYSEEDMQSKAFSGVFKNSDLRGKTGEPLHFLAEEIFSHEILPELRANEAFNEIFEPTRDSRGRLRFRMRNGRREFSNLELPKILQSIDRRAKELYDEIGRCFFEYDPENNKFVEKDDEYKRFALLPLDERRERINAYIGERPWLSRNARLVLQVLAEEAKDEKEVLERELSKSSAIDSGLTDFRSDDALKQAANRFWAYKDLVYTMVWSAKKDDGGAGEGIFGFDPMIFTVEGLPQSSSFTDKIILKRNGFFTPEQLASVQEREREIIANVTFEHPSYEIGPGIRNNV